MDKSDSNVSRLIYDLGNNLITIGTLQGSTDILNRYENFFVGEVMNEITHLPYDTFLIPFLKELSVSTKASIAKDVNHVGVWDIKNSYLNPDRDGHIDGLSVQPDSTIILEDYVVLFEFKKPHSTPSQNKVTLKELGRQVLLATKHLQDYDVSDYKIILINNSAPRVYIPKIGKVLPGEIVKDYFEKQEDKWFDHEVVEKLIESINLDSLEDNFHVVTWEEFIQTAIAVINDASNKYKDAGIEQLLLNSRESLDWFLERRKELLD